MSSSHTENKFYRNAKYSRRMARDCVAGSDTIKRANVIYLPMPKGFNYISAPDSYEGIMRPATAESDTDYMINSMPWFHSNEAYSSYLHRARFPELVTLARNGLVGIALQKKPVIKLPSVISYLEEQAGKDDESLIEIYAECIIEVLIAGNTSILVDIDVPKNQFFLNVVKAEVPIDWDENSNDDCLSFLNLATKKVKRSQEDIFKTDEELINYVYFMIDDTPVLQKYINDVVDGDRVDLNLQGNKFTRIPVFPIGSLTNSMKPQPAPLAGLCEIALSIYRKDADLSNAQFMTCNPTFVISGAEGEPNEAGESNPIPHIQGSQVALILANPEAKAYYTNTDTSALDHVRTSIQDLFMEAMMYSASIVGQEKKAAEAFDTVKSRQNAQNATLINIVTNVAKAIKSSLKFCAEMHGSKEEIIFSGNTDFAEKTISPQLLTALVQAWIARGLSLQTLLQNFKDAGILPKDSTVQDELTLIAAEPPAPTDSSIVA